MKEAHYTGNRYLLMGIRFRCLVKIILNHEEIG